MSSNAYKVLIVDDEFRIGMMIKKLIHWEDLNIECLDVIDRGDLALDIIAKKKPDIVITDIRMPKISGLDIISRTEAPVKFIVISGYKEFEYAHKALKHGIKDYLLKPINEEELNTVLGKVIQELNTSSIQKKQNDQLRETALISESIIKKNLLDSIIESTYDAISDLVKDTYILPAQNVEYQGLIIKVDRDITLHSNAIQEANIAQHIIRTIEKQLSDPLYDLLISDREFLTVYTLLLYQPSDRKPVKTAVNEILSDLGEYLMGYEQYSITIGLGKPVHKPIDIRQTIMGSFRAVQNRIKIGTGRLIYEEALEATVKVDIPSYMEQHRSGYLKCIESMSGPCVRHSINEIFGELQKRSDIDNSCFYELSEMLIELFFDELSLMDTRGEELKKELLHTCPYCSKIVQLKNLLKDHLGTHLTYCLETLENKLTKPVREAIRYIETHYGEKIFLEDVAEVIALNPVYFSVLFKKEMGMNFSTYLLEYRMEKAKNLIRSTSETISCIATQVGYQDPRYFSQVFTKHVGMKPTLYRTLYS